MLYYGAMHLPDFGPTWLKPDFEKALMWIDAAGSTGPSEVMHSLAILFNSGTKNVPRDQAEATVLALHYATLRCVLGPSLRLPNLAIDAISLLMNHP
jgi:TPR repeat protein